MIKNLREDITSIENKALDYRDSEYCLHESLKTWGIDKFLKAIRGSNHFTYKYRITNGGINISWTKSWTSNEYIFISFAYFYMNVDEALIKFKEVEEC